MTAVGPPDWPIAALPAVYVGAYFALLTGKHYALPGIKVPPGTKLDIEPSYRIAGVAHLLAPVHSADRVLRPDYWSTIASSSGLKWKNPPVLPASPRNAAD